MGGYGSLREVTGGYGRLRKVYGRSREPQILELLEILKILENLEILDIPLILEILDSGSSLVTEGYGRTGYLDSRNSRDSGDSRDSRLRLQLGYGRLRDPQIFTDSGDSRLRF